MRINSPEVPLIHSGKVRDSYRVSAFGQPYRLVMVSDRVSVYDFVLGFEIPFKGEVLSAMNLLMRLHLREKLPHIEQDLAAYGKAIDTYLPLQFRGNAPMQKVGTVVRPQDMRLVEVVIRGYLTGSGYKSYKQDGSVCGNVLPEGLKEGARLTQAIYTPTTKAAEGHDEPLRYQDVDREYGSELGQRGIEVYCCASSLAESRGLILVDTKVEFSKKLVLCDEVGTPDSSRYWDKGAYDKSYPAKLPPSLDKEFVRQWAQTHGINDGKKFDPKNAEHRIAVKQLRPPHKVVSNTTDIYLSVFAQMANMSLKQFQREVLSV